MFSRPHHSAGLVCVTIVCLCLGPLACGASAQDARAREVAVNLAEGRVVVCAAKDGIVVATTDARGEAGSLPPALLPVRGDRVVVMLGALEWVQPETGESVRLDSEFPRIASAVLNTGGQHNDAGASDIEALGIALLERLRPLAEKFHAKINLAGDEPLIRLVLVDNVLDYGPEAWTIDYTIHQDALGNDYWRTQVLRPRYNQLYPPEKGHPHTLVEVSYPPANRATGAPELIDLLRQNDSRLAPIRSANADVAKSVAMVVDGQSQKSQAAADADFLRAALPAVTPPRTKLAMALIDFDKGFQWLIEPPAAERPPVDTTPNEPGAPSLRHPNSK